MSKINSQRLLNRFLQYVQVDTTAVEETDAVPSSPGQIELGKILVAQLQEIGIADVTHNEFGIVRATIPARGKNSAPVVAFNSHVDTSPETTGKGVQPQVIENFDGNDIVLKGDPSKVITAAKCPELPLAKGQTIITTDGTTLLGADDKAGVSIIMEMASVLLESPEIQHGEIRLLFTCDEEVGRGVTHLDVDGIKAQACYTFDGGGRDMVDHETFSADLAIVTFEGINIHPAIAKGKMINAIRAAGDFITRLPAEMSPECTDGREPYVHPYVLDGSVGSSRVRVLIRDFDTNQLGKHADLIRSKAAETEAAIPGIKAKVEIKKQYRNMADGLTKEPRAVTIAVEAHERLGRKPELSIIRGGTDGSQMTERGLPTPNLSSGQHNIHSPLEWASLDEMVAACEVGIEIVKRWSEETN
ncbi:MAG: peptidase T [Pirellulaceae bacterium]